MLLKQSHRFIILASPKTRIPVRFDSTRSVASTYLPRCPLVKSLGLGRQALCSHLGEDFSGILVLKLSLDHRSEGAEERRRHVVDDFLQQPLSIGVLLARRAHLGSLDGHRIIGADDRVN
jgi:hypothetical protein